MPTGRANRRKTDQEPPDRAALAEARLLRLSHEVRAACDRFLASRDLPVRLPFMDYPRAPKLASDPEVSSTQTDTTKSIQ